MLNHNAQHNTSTYCGLERANQTKFFYCCMYSVLLEKMSRNNLVTIICFSQTSALAFQIQRWATKSMPCGPTKACNMRHHPPFISSGKRRRYFQISMASADDDGASNLDSKINDEDVLFPRPSLQQSELHNEDFASTDRSPIEWEPILDIQYEDMDDFLDTLDYPGDEYVDIDDDTLLQDFDKETLLEILGLEDDGSTITIPNDEDDELHSSSKQKFDEWEDLISEQVVNSQSISDLEKVLLSGVVPAEAGVGSRMLPGDEGFDPLEFATKNYFKQIQKFVLGLIPQRKMQDPEAGAAIPTVGFVGEDEDERPPALILRDYREAEIRHGRLAMLAAVIWPLQEILDRIFIPESFGSTTVIYGGTTMPFLPLIMTFMMLNLGYLDIYSSEIKENESGDAFLPGECFWDPLNMMTDAPDSMVRNMQEREILNGRAAMIAVAAYIFEEAMTHRPIVEIPTNALLFEPAYQVPFIQQWLDSQFAGDSFDYSTGVSAYQELLGY